MVKQTVKDTPWTAEYDGHGGVSLETEDGTQIVCLKGSRKKYAERIVHCVNYHEELVAALEKLARLGNGEYYGNSDGNIIARAALAKFNAN